VNRTVIAETMRRHLTNVGYLAYLALLALVGIAVGGFNRAGSIWPSLVTLLAFITGCGAIGPEFSSGTLQLILVKPVNRAVYLLSRVTGIVLVVWIAALLPAMFEAAARSVWGTHVPWALIGSALLNVCIDTILTVSLLALLGSITRAYYNIGIYITALVGLSVTASVLGMIRQSSRGFGATLARHPGIEQTLQTIDRNLFPEVLPVFDGSWILMVLTNASVALLLACLAFRRREVPYGAD
jgi:ABC-type transport system involved in multi-copper enzyme maturation permease subunit